jgi:hypothetical protein
VLFFFLKCRFLALIRSQIANFVFCVFIAFMSVFSPSASARIRDFSASDARQNAKIARQADISGKPLSFDHVPKGVVFPDHNKHIEGIASKSLHSHFL